jgi:hypothetical protein
MYRRRDLRIEDESFCGAAAISYAADIDAIDDCGRARDGGCRRHFGEAGGGGVSGDPVVNYVIAVCLGEEVLAFIRESEVGASQRVTEKCPRGYFITKSCQHTQEKGADRAHVTEISRSRAQT